MYVYVKKSYTSDVYVCVTRCTYTSNRCIHRIRIHLYMMCMYVWRCIHLLDVCILSWNPTHQMYMYVWCVGFHDKIHTSYRCIHRIREILDVKMYTSVRCVGFHDKIHTSNRCIHLHILHVYILSWNPMWYIGTRCTRRTRILMRFIIYYLVPIVNPMGKILVRWKRFQNNACRGEVGGWGRVPFSRI